VSHSIDVRLGYDGKCAIHRTTPTIFRRTPKDLNVELKDAPEITRFVNLIEVHCAAGHKYFAIDLDQVIPDPFAPEETETIIVEESAL
jgi:hypothetical protein